MNLLRRIARLAWRMPELCCPECRAPASMLEPDPLRPGRSFCSCCACSILPQPLPVDEAEAPALPLRRAS